MAIEEFSDEKIARLRFLLRHYITVENELRETIKDLKELLDSSGIVRVHSITELEDQE